jgi:hypothetical protein
MTSLPSLPTRVEDVDASDPDRRARAIVGGVDTHKDLHVAAVIDTSENVLGTRSFSTTRAGYRAMTRWMADYGVVMKVGIEGHRQLRRRDHSPSVCARRPDRRGRPARP